MLPYERSLNTTTLQEAGHLIPLTLTKSWFCIEATTPPGYQANIWLLFTRDTSLVDSQNWAPFAGLAGPSRLPATLHG